MILFLLLVLLLLSYLFLQQQVEGFELGPYYNDAVFDSFYSYHFDEIFNTIPLYEEMILKVMPLLTQGSSMLWIGSRNGHGVQLLNDMGNTIGLDGSSAMVKMSRYKYPSATFMQGTYAQHTLFSPHRFTAVFCPFMELHRVADLDVFMRNVSDWLVHYGYLVLTRIDLSQFPTGLLADTPGTFQYKSEFKGNEWIETFTNASSKTRTNKQTLYPYTANDIAAFAKRYDLKQINQYAGSLVPLQVLVFQKK
uniref:Methyltransferase type 11 domain-containing protein n=1 Tax=viral metagenome TaxID=1070528 RepID=A0A6C0HNM5_9ZZZZ